MNRYKLSFIKTNYVSNSLSFEKILCAIKGNCWKDFPEGLCGFKIDADALLARLPQGSEIEGKSVPGCREGYTAYWVNVFIPWRQISQAFLVCLAEICKSDLYMVDWQNNDKVWNKDEFTCVAPLLCRERCNAFLARIQNAGLNIYKILRIEDRYGPVKDEYFFGDKAVLGYSVILRRRLRDQTPPAKRVEIFYEALARELGENEKLQCRNRCFVISADDYQISFTLEGYNKNPSLIWYMGDDGPKSCPLGRMNSNMAMKRAQKISHYNIKDSAIWRRMGLVNMIDRFPNPAGRFAASVRIEQKLQKMDMGVRYDEGGQRHGTALCLFNTPGIVQDDKDLWYMDYLYIWDDAFSFIFPFIRNHAGDNFDYYSSINTLHAKIWKKIVKDMRRFACLILHDTFSSEVENYMQDACTYILSQSENPRDENKQEIIYKNRQRLYEFYNFICDWIEENLGYYDNIINIEGL